MLQSSKLVIRVRLTVEAPNGRIAQWLGHVTYNRKIGVRLSVLLPYASMVFNGSMTAFQAVGAGSNPVRRWSMFLITFTWYRLFKTNNEIKKGKAGRVDECNGPENRRSERIPGFESQSFLQMEYWRNGIARDC